MPSKERLGEYWAEMPIPKLIRENPIRVRSDFSGGQCIFRSIGIGPGRLRGSFVIDKAGTVLLPGNAAKLRNMLDESAGLLDASGLETAIRGRGRLDHEDYGICMDSEDDGLCLDPVNEWLVTLMHRLDPEFGNDFAGSPQLEKKYRDVMFPLGGLELPWLRIAGEERTALCEMFLAERIDQTEKFWRLTCCIEGLLWPGFRFGRKAYTWEQLEGML